MNNFKVVEIIDANTIRVSPEWLWSDNEGPDSGDKIKILGLDRPVNDEYFKSILTTILLDKEVELVNPEVVKKENDQIEIACNVIIDKTDLMYYFTLMNPKTKQKEFAYH